MRITLKVSGEAMAQGCSHSRTYEGPDPPQMEAVIATCSRFVENILYGSEGA